jgi:putative membrane protein
MFKKSHLLLCAAIAWAGSAGAAAMSDQDFAVKAARDGATEVALGHVAEQNGQSQAVKDFGRRMVKDHGEAGEKLKAAARQDGIALPEQAPPKASDAHELGKLKGAEFDRAYARQAVEDHEKAVAMFQREARDGRKEHVKVFAEETLPVLEDHLRMARALDSGNMGRHPED